MTTTRRTRTLLMVLLLIAALLMAVAPALAVANLNTSFEYDNNHDGKPDYWTVRGDVVRVCNHPVKAYEGDCFMVFPPSTKRAALFVDFAPVLNAAAEEGSGEVDLTTWAGARNMQAGRAFFGGILEYDDYDTVVVYTTLNGGSYDWTQFWVQNTGVLPDVLPDRMLGGYLVLPHTGSLGVDGILGNISINTPS